MTARDFKVLRAAPTPERYKAEAKKRLDRAETRARIAALGPKALQGPAARNLLHAIAVAEEWGVVGRLAR